MRKVLIVFIIFSSLFLTACSLTESEKEREAIRLELEEVIQNVYESLNEGDIDEYISFFSFEDEEIEKDFITQTTNRFIYLNVKTSLVDVFYEEVEEDSALLRVSEVNLDGSQGRYKYTDNEKEVLYKLAKEDGNWVIKERVDDVVSRIILEDIEEVEKNEE